MERTGQVGDASIEVKLATSMVLMPNDFSIFVLKFAAPEALFDNELPEFDKILKSYHSTAKEDFAHAVIAKFTRSQADETFLSSGQIFNRFDPHQIVSRDHFENIITRSHKNLQPTYAKEVRRDIASDFLWVVALATT